MLRSFTVAKFSRLLFATALFVGFTALIAVAQPSIQVSNVSVGLTGISWTNGNSTNRLVVVSHSGGVFTPVDGQDYTADINVDFNVAVDKDGAVGPVAKIVYGGTGNTVPVANLPTATFLTIKVYEFNGAFQYNLTNAINNPIVTWYYLNSGATTTYVVPAGVTGVVVQAWGGGGGGGIDNPTNNGAAGGGGGAYASGVAAVVFGTNPTVTIGAGGAGGLLTPTNGTAGGSSSFGSAVIALGGSVVNSGATGAAGGSGPSSTGTIKFSGGNGGNGGTSVGNGGGGGGSSATAAGAGVNGGNFSTGTGGTGGNGTDGDGGNGGNAVGATAAAGTFPGGGGGGRGDGNGNSAAGAGGLILVTYAVPDAPSTPDLTTDTGSSAADNITNDDTPTFAGTAESGSTVTIISSVDGVVGTGTATGGNYSITVSTLADGAHDITATTTNAMGNVSAASSPLAITIDTGIPAAPSVPDLTTDSGAAGDNLTNDDTSTFDGTAETGSTVTIISNVGGSVGTGTATGGNYSITVSTLAENGHNITATATDIAGNTSVASAALAIIIDTTAPTVVLNHNHPDAIVRDADAVTITAVFTEANGLAGTPTITIGSVVTNDPMQDGPLTWNYPWNVPGGNSGPHTVTLTASDAAGNPSAAYTLGTGVSAYTIDNTAPTVLSSNRLTPAGEFTNATSVIFQVTFDGNVTGVDAADFTATLSGVTAGAITTVTGSGSVYDITVPTIAGDGTVRLDVLNTATIADVAGNSYVADFNTGQTYTIDQTVPTVTVNQGGSQTDPTNVSPVTFTAVFSEAINPASFVDGDITLGGTATGQSIAGRTSGDNISWTITVAATGSGTITASIAASAVQDPAGNNNTASTSTDNTVTLDITPPSVTVDQDGAQTDPTNVSPVTFTAVFSEAIDPTSFVDGDITLGGTATGKTVTGRTTSDNITWTITVSATGDGTITASLGAGVVTDVLGNASLVSSSTDNTVTYDATLPATFTVGTVTTVSGTVRANYWNGTNGSVDVVVPIANDASLMNGFVQLQMKNGATSFTNIGTPSAISAVDTDKTINIPGGAGNTLNLHASYGETQVLTFTAIITDAAGNPRTGTQSVTSLTVDTTPPAIIDSEFKADNTSGNPHFHHFSCSGTLTTQDSNTEFIHLEMSEDLDIQSPDGTLVTLGTPGFTVSAGSFDGTCDTRGASVYHVASKTIHLKSSSNNNWNGTTTISFSSGGTNIRDLAGNEMASFVTLLPSDTQAPALATGLVFNPNGGGAEIITFQLSETLNGSVGTTVTGFTTNVGTIATADYNSGTNTVTLTATSDGMWTDAVLLSYSQGTGNVIDPAANELAAFINLPIRLVNVNIFSNNGNTPASRAKAGNTITLGFTTNAVLSATPTATIGGQSATVTGGPVNYSATITASVALTEGVPLAIAINALTAADVTDVSVTTNGSQMIYDQTTPTITPVTISSDNANSSSLAKVGNTVTLLFTVSETLFATPSVTIGGRAATVGGAHPNYSATLLLDGTEPSGVLAFNISIEDIADNAASATATTNASSVTFDKIVPTVDDITLPDANPNNTSSVDFDVLFTEAVTGVDATDFATYGTASGGGETISNVAGSGTSYTVTVSGIALTGTLGLSVVDDNTIEDAADNDLGGTALNDGNFSSATTYLIVLPQPANHVTGFNITATSYTNAQLAWTDAIGSPAPSGYLIAVERSGATALVPSDGTPIANQTNLVGNTTGYLNIGPGLQFANFNNLLSGENYTFYIYPYTNSGTNIDYKTDGTVPSDVTTTLLDNFVWINNASPLEPGSFASTTTSSGVAVINFRFQVYDNGWGSADNASTKITEVKIRRHLSLDQIGNWNDALAGVELTDGTTTKTGVIDPGGDFITFSGLYNGTTEFFGEVADDNFKYYHLKLILKTNLGGNLPQIIDNRSFVFQMNNADLTMASNSSQLNFQNDTNWPIASGSSNNKVDVDATQLDFTTNPTSPVLVMTDVTSPSAAPDFLTRPVVRARDLNGNTDLDYGSTVTVSNAGSLPMLNLNAIPANTLVASGGVITFPTNFQYGDDGNGTLTVTDGSITNAISALVTVDFSNTTTINAGVSAEPPTFSSLRDQTLGFNATLSRVFDFAVADDNGAGGDGSPTRISQVIITQGTGNDILDWTEAIHSALLFDGGNSISGTINPTNITFSGINVATLGFVGDNATKTYNLLIRLHSSMGGTLPSTIDNLNLVFEVLDDNVAVTAISSLMTGAEDENSGAANVAIDVDATQFLFTTQPPADVLVNANLTTSPALAARDINNNLDLDFSSAITVTNAGGLGMINVPTNFTNGLLTFGGTFQYTQIGNGQLTVSSAGITSAISTAVTVRVAKSTTITAGGDAEPATISSLTTSSPGTQVFDFTLTDDASTENDGNPTQLTSLFITLGVGDEIATTYSWTNAIAGATLSDGTNTVVASTIASNFLFFDLTSAPGIALGNVADNASKTFKLNIWLKNPLTGLLPTTIDGLNFQFDVQQVNIGTSVNGSSIVNGENENSGVANEVTVIATQLDVISPVSATNVSINTPFTPVIAARDANGNQDLDFEGASGTVTEFTNASSAATATGPTVGATQFTNGLLDFTALFPNFQFTGGNNNDDVTLSMKAGTGTICATDAICTVISPVLTLKSNTITAGALAEPPTISSIAATPVSVFDFIIRDDDNQTIGTDSNPTKISSIIITPLSGENEITDWTELIASATLTGSGVGTIPHTSINATSITFSGINNAIPGNFGHISDNASRVYTLNIVLQPSFGGSLPQTVDNLHLAFEVLATNITVTLPSSTFSAAENENSGTTSNAIDVLATEMAFTTDMTSPLLPNKDISAQQSVPVIQAMDSKGNRDLDYNSTTINVTNAGSLTMVNVPATNSLAAGLLTFPANFQYTQVGTGTLTVSSSNTNAIGGTLTSAISAPVTVQTGIASTITAGAAAPATFSSLTTTSPGTTVFNFDINDDPSPGTPVNQDDGSPTLITQVIISQNIANNTVSNWTLALAGARLSDGTNNFFATSITPTTIVFSGIPKTPGTLGYVTDNGTKSYTLNVWLKTALELPLPTTIDGLRMAFEVTTVNVTTDFTGTSILAGQLQHSGTSNVVDVDATRLDFSQLSAPDNFISPYSAANFPANGSINSPFVPRLGVEAHDVNSNLDLDFTGSITAFTIANGLNTINDPSGSFVAGQLKFPANFEYTSGNNQDGQMTMTAGGITSSSPSIIIISSFESWVTGADQYILYTPPTTIDYAYHQAADIQNDANSFEMIQLVLSDGDADFKQDGLGTALDQDGANTVLTEITFGVNNYQAIRRIALYDDLNNEIQELDDSDFDNISGNYGEITFTGLNIVAIDDNYKLFRIRASFHNTPATIVDNTPVQLSFVGGVLGSGSKFYDVPPGSGTYILGNPPTDVTAPPTINVLEVTATKFDFTTQPGVFAGINEPVTTGIVEARDQFNLVDLDFNFGVNLSTPAAGLNFSGASFTAGELDLTGMQYTSPGNGTVTVSYNLGAITSNMTGLSSGLTNVSTQCNHIDVIHVTATENVIGFATANNLTRGSTNVVLFGVTFEVPYKTAAHPKLKDFSFIFSSPFETQTTTTFTNFRVFESTDENFPGSNLVTSEGGTITLGQSPLLPPLTPAAVKDMVTVTFAAPANYRNLNGVAKLTYYIMADVDQQVNLTTPKVTVKLLDDGYGSPTNSSIILTQGSAVANLESKEYSFASTRAPQLIDSYPKNGQLNVDPAQSTISLIFDVGVLTLDGEAKLYDRQNNKLMATLSAINGRFELGEPAAGSILNPTPLTFQIPSGVVLKHDSIYYVTIEKGTYDPVSETGKGISDDGFNLFGGISYNGTLYFKIASDVPPKMIETEPLRYYVTETGGAINAALDQFGKAYFMVVDENDPVPTNDEIKGSAASYLGTAIARGTIDINQVYPNVQFGTFAAALSPDTYDVWMYAENDALPIPVPTTEPYGPRDTVIPANSFVEGTGTPGNPTFKLVVDANPGTLYLNNPTYSICANSFTTLADPIIIGEGNTAEFAVGVQNFNILLPTGFEFDTNTYPTLTLLGSDFDPGLDSVSFLSGSVLHIIFDINSTASFDKIIISNIRVRGSVGASGEIKRFAGDAIPTLLDGQRLAGISAIEDPPSTFINTFAVNNDFSSIGISNDVTTIPDNFFDVTLADFAARLIPQVPAGDYGASFFTGSGVTNDLLSLSGVPLNSAFDISMTHTDMNGCISTKTEQYEVYDHLNAIPALVDSTYGTKACIENPYYLQGLPAPSLNDPNRLIDINSKAGYNLLELYVKIPETATKLDSAAESNPATAQIMHGQAWDTLVTQIPVIDTVTSFGKAYTWDYSVLLPLNSTHDPYEYFDELTPTGQTYYKGGSLGKVEFTGKYQSTADGSVLVPIRQEIEIFIPAIPVVEVTGQNSSAGLTPIFCENTPEILVSGYPAASAGASTGTFVLRDSATNALIVDPDGFIDNSNGSAKIIPNAVNINSYNTLRVDYTYQDDNSPCGATGFLYIRIAPNPVAQFNAESVIGSNTPVVSAYCEDREITFDATTSIGTIANYKWNFDDPNNITSTNPNEPEGGTGVADIVPHKFNQSAPYAVSLIVTSNYACPSPPLVQTISVGKIPVVDFTFLGISTADPITFTNTSTIGSASTVTDGFAQLNWVFDDPSIEPPVTTNFLTPLIHNYLLPDKYDVNLTVTSIIGCRNTLTKPIIVVPRATPTASAPYEQTFDAGGGNWQTAALPIELKSASPAKFSWTAGNSIWKTTSTNGTYMPLERSALYSPSFDISQLPRPMISFNSLVQLETSDGVVLEYSVDNKNVADPTKEWFALGQVGDGVDWFTDQNITAKPGNQASIDLGWSGSKASWLESKHALVDEAGKPPLNAATRVVFRFALASAKQAIDNALGGFGIDNVRIGNRTRIVLLENFRNLGDAKMANADETVEMVESNVLKGFSPGGAATSVVKINYHVGFPSKDPLNLDNAQDPGARALYYNISKTPRVQMDGDHPGGDDYFSQWGTQLYNVRSLKLADATLIPTITNNSDGSIEVSVNVTALKDLGPKTLLNIAVVEKSIDRANIAQEALIKTGENNFEYVLKKMLPSAAGTRFNTTLSNAQSRTFGPFTWSEAIPLYTPVNDLAVVIFLQDEDSREIYQTDIIDMDDPSITTGIEDRNTSFNVYPIPADNEMVIELPEPATRRTSLQMYDQLGKVVEQSHFEKGDSKKSVNTTSFAAGVYLIQIDSPKGILRRKVMVVHKN